MSSILNIPVIGLMSGTSLDGLDVCFARFSEEGNLWKYKIEAAETFSYPAEWTAKLIAAEKTSGAELMRLHSEYGDYLGRQVSVFLKKHGLEKPLLVASHGHTIFHRPEQGYTFQLGNGASLSAACGIPVVCDFRSLDVALGGQGAPLVPAGDALLFGHLYDWFLNLGGFANISFVNGKKDAYDICAVNYVLNRLAKRAGKNFDEDGAMSARGEIIPGILEQLNALPYYKKSPPKSIGREWVEETIFPLLPETEKTENLLRTYTEHIVEQISNINFHNGEMLITGGGTHNGFLIRRLKEKCKVSIVIPDSQTVDFKEALIFGFLGLLRWNNRVNTFASVTGAVRDSSGGIIVNY